MRAEKRKGPTNEAFSGLAISVDALTVGDFLIPREWKEENVDVI